MGRPILIIGKSGVGKSASLRNLKDYGLIKVIDKDLPFKSSQRSIVSDNYQTIKQAILGAKVNTIVIDDANYLMTNEFMRRSKEKGYDKFTELAEHFWDLIMFVKSPDIKKNVYFFMHEDKNDIGDVKPKTIGRMLDEKVCVEGLFTIVLRAVKNDKRHVFRTITDGFDIVKTPIGMFEQEEIDNDLLLVENAINNYYKEEK